MALTAGLEVTHGFYLLAVDFFILSWVLTWLGIFRTRAGGWRIWPPISISSFFAYLYHRPIWHVLVPLLADRMGLSAVMFQFIPGTVIALFAGYIMQRGYNAVLQAGRRF
jgi:hypothetical protein